MYIFKEDIIIVGIIYPKKHAISFGNLLFKKKRTSDKRFNVTDLKIVPQPLGE
jgi:hypothetical protein